MKHPFNGPFKDARNGPIFAIFDRFRFSRVRLCVHHSNRRTTTDKETRQRVIADTYKAATDLLSQAAAAAGEAATAAAAGHLNLARGTAIEAETCLATATKMLTAAAAVFELPLRE